MLHVFHQVARERRTQIIDLTITENPHLHVHQRETKLGQVNRQLTDNPRYFHVNTPSCERMVSNLLVILVNSNLKTKVFVETGYILSK